MTMTTLGGCLEFRGSGLKGDCYEGLLALRGLGSQREDEGPFRASHRDPFPNSLRKNQGEENPKPYPLASK